MRNFKVGDKVRYLDVSFGEDDAKAYLKIPTYTVTRIEDDQVFYKVKGQKEHSSYKGRRLLHADNVGPFADHYQTFPSKQLLAILENLH